MNITNALLNLIVTHISDVYDIVIENPKTEDGEIHGEHNGKSCVVTLTFVLNEITQECVDIELYSDDISEIDDVNIDRDDRDNDDIYAEINDMGDFDHFMTNELDDDEDLGQSM